MSNEKNKNQALEELPYLGTYIDKNDLRKIMKNRPYRHNQQALVKSRSTKLQRRIDNAREIIEIMKLFVPPSLANEVLIVHLRELQRKDRLKEEGYLTKRQSLISLLAILVNKHKQKGIRTPLKLVREITEGVNPNWLKAITPTTIMKEESKLIKLGLIRKTQSQPIGPALNLQVVRLIYALETGDIISKEEADVIRNEIIAEIKEEKYPQTNLKSSSVTLVISKVIDLNFSRTKKKAILIALCPESSYDE
ncbi:MAG: hypothetical protein KAR35_08660, partial [Candidatus Heimdallarchaeota archaeon]|nr:hypothetical protein [Candidatus Heimdallarchaeota archaeon]MCK5049429.1 hypothetical protein [Candidatus Heimdallarchaeota archaeon]